MLRTVSAQACRAAYRASFGVAAFSSSAVATPPFTPAANFSSASALTLLAKTTAASRFPQSILPPAAAGTCRYSSGVRQLACQHEPIRQRLVTHSDVFTAFLGWSAKPVIACMQLAQNNEPVPEGNLEDKQLKQAAAGCPDQTYDKGHIAPHAGLQVQGSPDPEQQEADAKYWLMQPVYSHEYVESVTPRHIPAVQVPSTSASTSHSHSDSTELSVSITADMQRRLCMHVHAVVCHVKNMIYSIRCLGFAAASLCSASCLLSVIIVNSMICNVLQRSVHMAHAELSHCAIHG